MAAKLQTSAVEQPPLSRTALGAAGHRAAHQALEEGRIFYDPLAIPILGEDAEAAIAAARTEPSRRPLRAFIAARSRIAEERAAAAIGAGLRQIVALGAGLDTLAYRLAPTEGLTVFEVDREATQREKRRRLATAGIAEPANLRFVVCDFERESFLAALADRGFDGQRRALFIWLGVVPYLSESAVMATLKAIAGLPGGEVAFDYSNPIASVDDAGRREAMKALETKVARAGENIVSRFATPALHKKLSELGFTRIRDYGPQELAELIAPGSPRPASNVGGRIVVAAV
jgi:methyltransferase (TIGR00027 family)